MRPIDADSLLKAFCGHCEDYENCKTTCFDFRIIQTQPTVDAVPVVRCKDCKHRIVNEHYGEKGYIKLKAYCELDTGDIFSLCRCAEDDNWFCADGERKEEDT